MQKKDIKVGRHYAYQSYKHGTRFEVVVVGHFGKVVQGYAYNSRKVSGITVRFVGGNRDGETFVTTGRNIVHTWDEELAIRARNSEMARARHNEAQALAARRAAKAVQIDALLAAHGVEARAQSVYDSVRHSALKAVGFEEVDTAYNSKGFEVRFDLEEWMRHGRLNEKVVTVLLADSLTLKGA